MVKTHARAFVPLKLAIARNARSAASCTTSSASARLPVSQHASANASDRCGTTILANRARSISPFTSPPVERSLHHSRAQQNKNSPGSGIFAASASLCRDRRARSAVRVLSGSRSCVGPKFSAKPRRERGLIMPAGEACFTATGPNAARPDALRNPHNAGIRVTSTLDPPSHNERFLSIAEDIKRVEKCGMPDLYRKLSCADRAEFDRWLKANAVVATIFSVALVVMAFVGARPAGPVEGATGRNTPGLQREFRVPDATLWDKVHGKVRDARERHKRSSQ